MSPNYPQPLVTLSLRISVQQRRVVNKLLTLKKKKKKGNRGHGKGWGEATAGPAGAPCGRAERVLVGTRRIDSALLLGGGVRVPSAHTSREGQPSSLTVVPGVRNVNLHKMQTPRLFRI